MNTIGKLVIMMYACASLIACTNAEPKVYSLAEMGQMKHIYRYADRTMLPAMAIIDNGYVTNSFITYFNVTTLNNGSAFVTITITTDTGSYFASEYILLGRKVSNVIYPDTSITMYTYTVDLSDINHPLLTVEVDYDGNYSNNVPQTVEAIRIY